MSCDLRACIQTTTQKLQAHVQIQAMNLRGCNIHTNTFPAGFREPPRPSRPPKSIRPTPQRYPSNLEPALTPWPKHNKKHTNAFPSPHFLGGAATAQQLFGGALQGPKNLPGSQDPTKFGGPAQPQEPDNNPQRKDATGLRTCTSSGSFWTLPSSRWNPCFDLTELQQYGEKRCLHIRRSNHFCGAVDEKWF